MPEVFSRIKAQDQASQQRVPVSFRYLEIAGYGDDTAPGQWTPLISDINGNLFVTLSGSSPGPLLIPDDVDDVAEVSTDDRLPTVARLYALDGNTNSDFDRLRTDDDANEASDADSLPALRVMGRNRLYNNNDDQWQRQKSQGTETIAASAARTATTIFGNFLNTNWTAAHYIVNVTVIPADDITVFIEARDVVSLVWYPILESLAIAATGTTVLKVGQGFTPVPNLTANDMLPYITRVRVVHSGASSITYSIGANYGV